MVDTSGMDTRAVILVAGRGKRLGGITAEVPKCLLAIGGRAILDRQIEVLTRNGVHPIVIVLGFQATKVIKHLHGLGDEMVIVNNEDYATTDNLYSLHLASDHLIGNPFILMNGDVLVDDWIIEQLIGGNNDIVPFDSSHYDLEELKARVEGHVTEILPKDAPKSVSDGSTIGVFKFSSSGGSTLLHEVERMVKNNILHRWFEAALNNVLDEIRPSPLDIVGHRWIEIDTPEDLERANRIFG